MRGLIGKKIGMTQVYHQSGQAIPVTVVEAGPCIVTQVKNKTIDGYDAIQVGFGDRKPKHSNKALNGHFNKAGTDIKRVLAEFVPVTDYEYKTGQKFGASLFKVGEYVDVSGTSKGKGFTGVMKRHGFSGGRRSHGKNSVMRKAGSIGAGSDPSRVWPGTRMAGRMGNENVTVKNLEVTRVEKDKNLVFIKGAVPGAKNGIVFISKN